jgi:hypothetical protein
LTHTPAAVRQYAIIGLAAVGDDRAWSAVHQILGQQLDRPPPTRQPRQLTSGLAQFAVLATITYLVRHLQALPAERIPPLVETTISLRPSLPRGAAMAEPTLARHRRRGPAPDRLDPPDVEPFRAWVANTRLLGPVF